MNTNETFKVGIYLRLSRDDEREDESQSISNQRDYIIHAYRNELYSNLLASLTVSSGNSGDLLQVFNKYKSQSLKFCPIK